MKVFIIISNSIVISMVLVLLLVAPPEVPLYYSRVWGEQQLASKWALILLPTLMNIAFLITKWIMYKKFLHETLLHHVVRFALFVQVALTISILLRLFLMIQF